MNSLGITLVWLAVQVTILALAGIALTMLAARRRPGGGASAALMVFVASLLLTALAWCPLPSWWTVAAESPAESVAALATNADGRGSPAQDARQPAPSSEGRVGLAELLSAFRDLVRAVPGGAADNGSWQWPAAVALLAVIATGVGFLRLACGLVSIRRRWRRSRPVTEPELVALVEQVRMTLGIKRPVALVEWAELSSAATVGWRKPVLLLPGDWRAWTAEQRRAVIAHELAHVARSDFASALLAQLNLVLHFWHPFVHFLVRQFHLQQELAADAAAAPVAGGRSGYLRALAALALRSDGRTHGWPAPALLSPKGTLLRRVEMLRSGREGNRTVSRLGRQLTFGGLIALVITLSLLRGSVGQTLADTSPNAASRDAALTVPFDLSLLRLEDDKRAVGVYGVRPAALLTRPGMEPMRHLITSFFEKEIGELGIHVEDVEQAMGRIYILGEDKPGKRGIVFNVSVLRMTKDTDWKNIREHCGLQMTQRRWKGEPYAYTTLSPYLAGLMGVKEACLWAPDARTLIIDAQAVVKTLIEARTSGQEAARPDYVVGWDRFSKGLFVLALDNSRAWLGKASLTKADIKEATPGTPEYDLALSGIGFIKNTSRVVIGCAGDDDLQVDLWARTKTAKRAAELSRHCESALAAAKRMVAGERSKDPATKDTEAIVLAFVQNLLTGAVVHREGNVVTVHASASSGFNAILSAYVKRVSEPE